MQPPSKTLPPNTVRAHIMPGLQGLGIEDYLRPAQVKRDWMDNIPQQYVYRCIPLLAANTMGWELLNPTTSHVSWSGGDLTDTLRIRTEGQNPFSAGSHFGTGIVTWYVPFLFRTSPDLGLIVTGPANHKYNDAVPLDAFIRTDWLPFPFTMNWRLTRANTLVTFKAGEPLARIMPFPLTLIEETQLEVTDLASDPGFMAEVEGFGQARQQNIAKQQADARRAQGTGEQLTGEGVWNAQYVRAKGNKERGFAPHQTIFKPSLPKDLRGDPE
ncbi:MAG: DUF6065 family protein [Pseudomonadota bacterium]